MRSFLHCWGRQEPSLLCPAVAASPPPLSAFHSSPSSTTTILPEPATLFTNIDRQLLSASLTASVGVGQQQQPSPPQVSPQNQQSPPSAPEAVAAAIASTIQNQQFPSPPSATTASATPLPIPNSSNHLLAVAAATVAAAQQQSPQQQQQQTNIPQSSPAQKGLDAFFAALANANGPNSNNNNGQNGTTIPAQTSAVGVTNKPNNAAGQIFGGGQEATATTNPLASLIGANENSANNANQQAPGTTTQQQQLAETLQTAATNAIANAVNAVNAVTFMNAAIAVQQQQIQQQQTQQVAAAVAAAPLLNTLATLKQQQSQPSLLQSAQQNNNDQIVTVTNGNANAALNNALQLAAAQSAIQQQQKQQSSNIEQSPQQLRGGPLSPEGIVQAGLPALLRLTVPNIIRPGPSQSKPIPLLEDKVDLLRFKRKEPREWSSDDVVAWILDVARRHQIPCENLNLAKFASCNGPLLMLMNEQSFKENDLTYGSLLFSEFCKLITDENFIDEWMRTTGAGSGECSTSNMAGSSCHQPPPPQTIINHPQMQQQQMPSTASNLLAANLATLQQYNEQQAGPSSASTVIQQIPQQSQQQQSNLLLAAAAGIAAVQQHQQQQQKTISTFGHHQLLPPPSAIPSANSATLLGLQPPQVNGSHQMHAPQPIASLSKMLQQNPQMPPGNNRQQQQMMMASTSGAVPMSSTGMRMMRKVPVEQKIRRNKDGRPRKRSQHTKGNKLWEFIRDALKDPRTCPSIVRWEDPSEGVFRIVESERLAFLWGQKKNNQKMTYEKLSRAMRTYYEKEILVPVPKSGLYPKKLVYKFGPSAMGWKMAASMAVQSQLALLPNSHQQHHHLHRI